MKHRLPLSLEAQCALAGLPAPVREHRFHATRRWRFDWAWPSPRVAVEQEGGAWAQGRHTRGSGFAKDIEKYGEAFALGWRVLRVQPVDIATGKAVQWLLASGVLGR